ncbi:unnamed protein product [Rhizophagus irregularis]|uniref:Uncharacterized protein n=1 Tax=Rhizophagus irregularis TaxID=588596 RepID=A0A915ZUN7_9GLOM|nr:unnamed protein product [Rhizophagus irregularis]
MATDNNKDFTLSLAEAQHLTQENTSAMDVYQTFKDFSLVSQNRTVGEFSLLHLVGGDTGSFGRVSVNSSVAFSWNCYGLSMPP